MRLGQSLLKSKTMRSSIMVEKRIGTLSPVVTVQITFKGSYLPISKRNQIFNLTRSTTGN